MNKRLKKAANEYTKHFSWSFQFHGNNGYSSKTRSTPTVIQIKIYKLTEGSHLVEDDRKIANILNNCFARLGLYKSKEVSPNPSSLTSQGPKFNFRPVTLKGLCYVINNRPLHKSPGPGYIPSWALRDIKLSLELIFHLSSMIV